MFHKSLRRLTFAVLQVAISKTSGTYFARTCHLVVGINCSTTVSDFVDMIPRHLRYHLQ